MTIAYSLFSSSTDTRPARQDARDWSVFVARLQKFSALPRPANQADKLACPSVSPAIYEPGTTRANDNVIAWGGWIGADIDDCSRLSMEEAHAVFGDINHILYTTTKCRAGAERCRLLVQLNRHVPRDDIPAAWLGLYYLLDRVIDRQCRDLGRFYYVPQTWTPGDENPDPLVRFMYVDEAGPLSVETLVSAIPDDVEVPTLVPAPPPVTSVEGTPSDLVDLIPKAALDAYLSLLRGEHHLGLYSFMVAVAANAIRTGKAITAIDLVRAARIADAASPIKTASSRWSRIISEAGRALSYAAANVQPNPGRKVGLFGL